MPHRSRRWIFVAIAVAAAALFALSVWVGQWWTTGEVAIGPLGSHHCFGGDCRPAGLAWIGAGELWQRFAVATWVGGLLSMVLLLGIAGALAAGRAPKLLAKSTLVSIITTAVAGGYLIAKMPALGGLQLGQGIYLFVAAVVLGVVTTVRVLR